jgi:tRNA threonylcarbamoyladenosine biosynthesis protein TsaE
MQTVIIENLDAMKLFAQNIAGQVSSKCLILLDGPMGAGKTQFTRFLVEALGGDQACSPSFAIHNRYETISSTIEHFDLFRLESTADLESTGFWDFFLESEGLVIVEWAQHLTKMGIKAPWPLTWPRIEIDISFTRLNNTEGLVSSPASISPFASSVASASAPSASSSNSVEARVIEYSQYSPGARGS